MTSPSDGASLPPAIANLRALPGIGAPRIFRSSALCGLSAAGREELRQLDLAAVIDLRELSEVSEAPDEIETATPGTAWINIPLYQGPVPMSTPIEQVYRDLLVHRRPQLCAAVSAVARYASAGVLVHCKAGKDRTGLVAGLVLEAAGVARELIVDDYALSETALSAHYRDQVLAMVHTAELDDDAAAAARELHLQSPPAALRSALDMLDRDYGSVTAYLRSGGVATAEIDVLRAQLNPAAHHEEAS